MSLDDLIYGANCSKNSKNSSRALTRNVKTHSEKPANCSVNSKNSSRQSIRSLKTRSEKSVSVEVATAIPAIPATTRRPKGKPLPPALAWQFVALSPFTSAMVMDAAERWGEPLCPGDIKDIDRGKYLDEASDNYLREHLRTWAADNPERMNELKTAHCDPAQLPRAAIQMTSEGPAKGMPNFWFTDDGREAWNEHKKALKPWRKIRN